MQYNPIPHNTPGEYPVTYTATDAAGNVATAVRTVIVRNNPDAGVITLTGDPEISVEVGGTFTDRVTSSSTSMATTSPPPAQAVSKVGSIPAVWVPTPLPIPFPPVPASFPYGRTCCQRHRHHPPRHHDGRGVRTDHLPRPGVHRPSATASDAYDGNLLVGSSGLFPKDGLILHLDASSSPGLPMGTRSTSGSDVSGASHPADLAVGTPVYAATSIGGKPAVRFDGVSALYTSHWFGNTYSFLSISKLEGTSNQRLLSSFDSGWFIGYDSDQEDVFYPNGWSTQNHPDATANPHLYSAISNGSNNTMFYADGVDKTVVSRRNGNIGRFQMGAYRNMELSAKGDVSEVLIYNRALTTSERLGVEALLNAKYGLNGATSDTVPLDPNKLGTYSIVYQAVDGSGNLANAVRTVNVVPDPNAPVINLTGEAIVDHEKGAAFTDPGATLQEADGTPMDANLITVNSTLDSHKRRTL